MANHSKSSENLPDNKAYTDAINDAKHKNIQSLMNRLSADDRKKVENILSSPEETKKLLSNPKVQELIRKLKGNG